MSASASKTSLHGTCPVPGVPRSFSHVWTWSSRSPTSRIASPSDFSSMFMWNVSSSTPTLSAPTRSSELEHLLGGVDQVGLEAVQRLDREPHATLAGVVGDVLEALDGERALLLALGRLEHPRLADGRVHRPDDVRRADRGGQVDALLDVVDADRGGSPASSCERSRSGPKAPQTVKPDAGSRAPASRTTSPLISAGSSTASSSRSKPNSFARATNPSSASLKGDVQIHVDAPSRFISLLRFPASERDSTPINVRMRNSF